MSSVSKRLAALHRGAGKTNQEFIRIYNDPGHRMQTFRHRRLNRSVGGAMTPDCTGDRYADHLSIAVRRFVFLGCRDTTVEQGFHHRVNERGQGDGEKKAPDPPQPAEQQHGHDDRYRMKVDDFRKQ
jgi:hypothetical protein